MEFYIKTGRQTIDNNTLAALTLLIAESNPKEKEIIIDLVMNFLKMTKCGFSNYQIAPEVLSY
ncbi:MAG: hypothetical protein ACLU2J_06620 [Clostridia bacterium]